MHIMTGKEKYQIDEQNTIKEEGGETVSKFHAGLDLPSQQKYYMST